MSCGNTSRNCNAKSCQRYYNNNAQALAAGQALQLTIAGSKVVDSGVSIETEPQNFNTVKAGLYHISGDVVFEGSAAGDITFQVYMDGVALPCTLKTVTAEAATNTSIHTETDLNLTACCCNVSHTFTFVITSVGSAAGSVIEACLGILKLA